MFLDLKLLIKYESRYSHSSPPNVNLYVTVHKEKTQKNEIELKPADNVQPTKTLAARPKTPGPKSTCPNSPHPKSSLTKRLIAERDTDPTMAIEKPNKHKSQQTNGKPSTATVQIDKENIADKPVERKPSNRKSCSGKLIRNTPTDLYQKYQEDWIKYKNCLPGENSRDDVREVVRKKFQLPTERKPKVRCFNNQFLFNGARTNVAY